MTKAGEKIIAGAKEALSFARGECEHEWVREWRRAEGTTSLSEPKIMYCNKCRVRVTTYPAKSE